MKPGPLAGVALAGLCLWAGAAGAHNRGTSYSDWSIGAEGAEVRARVSQLDLTRLQLDPSQTPDYAARVAALLADGLQLWSADGRCLPAAALATPHADGWVTARWSLRCPDAAGYTIRSSLLLAVAPSHLHLARARIGSGAAADHVLTYAEPFVTLDAPRDAPASLARYLALGMEHILSGWDHLAFVLALILLAASLKEVALVATGFTLAHSLTLAAAVLGWAQVHTQTIEALIGLSIVLVAAENLWRRSGRERGLPLLLVLFLAGLGVSGASVIPGLVLGGLALFVASYFSLAAQDRGSIRLRFAVAFVFGLIHGFGFAGAMVQLSLPPERLALALIGFNSGVELGQLLAIGLAWPLLRWLQRAPRARAWVGDGASAGICALGTFWFLSRAFG